MSEWTLYREKRPESAGVYEWRLLSAAVPELVLIVAAHMRWRGAGAKNVLSPVFDYWDGYRVSVPPFAEWRATTDHQGIKSHEQIVVAIEGLEPGACIYCGKRPEIKGFWKTSRGIVVCAEPWRWNSWRFRCCEWGNTPSRSDPRDLEVTRRAAIAKALNTDTKGEGHE